VFFEIDSGQKWGENREFSRFFFSTVVFLGNLSRFFCKRSQKTA